MFKPVSINPVTRSQGIESQQRLWKDKSSTAIALTIPDALVVSVSGRLRYQHFVEICFFVAKRWRVAQEHLVVDLSRLKIAEASGIRYLSNQLYALAHQTGGHIYFVRVPPAVKVQFDRTWASENVHFVQSLRNVVFRRPALQPTLSGSAATRPRKLRGKRKAQVSNLQESARIANLEHPIVK